MIRKLSCAAFITASAILLACSHTPKTPPNEPPALGLDAKLGNKFLESGASGTMVARIALKAKRRSSSRRPPVNLALLVDTSGSMDGKAISDARAASLALVESLSPEDRIAVVTFDSKAHLLLPSTKLDETNGKELREKLSKMQATGTTQMANGLWLAVQQVQNHLVSEGVNRVVLLGDGVPDDDRNIMGLVSQAAAHGISITALGLGNDYDETLMGQIAQASGGRFFYVEDSSKVASFFAEEVTRLHDVVARGMTLELNPGPGVTVTSVVGRPIVRMDRTVKVWLGDLSIGEEQEIVVELASTPTHDGATVEVVDAVVRYNDAVGAPHEEHAFVAARSTTDGHALEEGREKAVEDALARAKDAATTLDAINRERNAKRVEPQVNVAYPAPAAQPAPAMAPEQVRKLHDQSMRNFQAQ